MKYFLISDNVDTLAGMRLVGVHGVVVHEEDEVRAALEKACADEEIGLVLITDKLVAKCADTVFAYKLGAQAPADCRNAGPPQRFQPRRQHPALHL